VIASAECEELHHSRPGQRALDPAGVDCGDSRPDLPMDFNAGWGQDAPSDHCRRHGETVGRQDRPTWRRRQGVSPTVLDARNHRPPIDGALSGQDQNDAPQNLAEVGWSMIGWSSNEPATGNSLTSSPNYFPLRSKTGARTEAAMVTISAVGSVFQLSVMTIR
jgi:hypothetical protein